MLEQALERAADIAWAVAFFVFLGLGLWAYERGVKRRDEARREHAREIELAAHRTYADCRRARRVDIVA